jgi:hypothetical protein
MIMHNAFRTTGLYPLSAAAADSKPGASTMGEMFSGEVCDDVVENPLVEKEHVGELQQEAVLIMGTNTVASKGTIIHKAVLEYLKKPRAKDSAAIHKEILAMQDAKKIAANV